MTRLLLATVLLAGPAGAATFNVDVTADGADASPGNGVCATAGGTCTLRAAIMEANAMGASDTIVVPAGTYTLSIPGADENAAATGDLDVTNPVTINGAGAGMTIVDAAGIDRVFDVGESSTIRGLTVMGGDAQGLSGGGMFAAPFGASMALTLEGLHFVGNVAFHGGGIMNEFGSDIVVRQSSFTANSASFGSAIENQNDGGTLENVTISGNGGGTAIRNGVTLDVVHATVAGTVSNAGLLSFRGTIFDNGPAATTCTGDAITSNGWNLEHGTSCGLDGTGDLGSTDPTLGPLVASSANGTFVLPLLPGSPAIDVAGGCPGPATDQRGLARPIDGDLVPGAVCDVGAFESDPTAGSTTTSTTTTSSSVTSTTSTSSTTTSTSVSSTSTIVIPTTTSSTSTSVTTSTSSTVTTSTSSSSSTVTTTTVTTSTSVTTTSSTATTTTTTVTTSTVASTTTSSTTTTVSSTTTSSTTTVSSTTTSSTTTVSSTTTTLVSTTTTIPTTTTLPPGQRLGGRKLLLKDSPTKPNKRRFILVSKDAAVTLGDQNGSNDDPVINGGSLRVAAMGGDGFDETYPLVPGNWRYIKGEGKNKGYKFAKGTPIKKVIVKPGKVLKIIGKGPDLVQTLVTEPDGVVVELRLGDRRYCFEFGPATDFVADKKLLVKDSGAPAACLSDPGEVLALTYNVAGLPEALSGSEPHINTPLISPLLNGYDLVLAQETWLTPDPNPNAPLRTYHELLIADVDHPYLSEPLPAPLGSDPMRPSALVSDGLNRMSRWPFEPVVRQRWSDCADVGAFDCLALKGFSMATTTFAPGVEIDVYNLHMEAGGSEDDERIRDDGVTDLVAFIDAMSPGRPLIVGGDFNLHDDEEPDATVFARLLQDTGLIDVCTALGCAEPYRIDKFLYRSSPDVFIEPLSWNFETDVFMRGDGEPLSDHDPLAVRFRWTPR